MAAEIYLIHYIVRYSFGNDFIFIYLFEWCRFNQRYI